MEPNKLNKLLISLRAKDIQSLNAYDAKTKTMNWGKKKFNFENFVKSMGAEQSVQMPAELVAQLMPQIMNNQNNVQFIPPSKNVPTFVPFQSGNSASPLAAAMFDFTINRKTANLAFDLPVPVFGIIDRASNYKQALAKWMPAGCTLAVANTTAGTGLKLTYTIGGDSDIIEIECAEKPYLSFLQSLASAVIKISQTTLSILDAADVAQWNRSIRNVTNSMFGKNSDDSFTPNQFRDPKNFDNTVRIITAEQTVDEETTYVYMMAPIADNQLTQTSFVEFYDVRNRKSV